MIELQNLSKSYKVKKEEVVALDGVNLKVEKGDIYGIIGLSGEGKSTLVRCINLLEKPTSGKVLIDGEDLTAVGQKRLRQIRQKVSMIFQQFNLLQQRTVLKNVELAGEIANLPNAKDKAISLLKLVGLEDKMNSYPSQLSGGQQQRVAIARALMTEPKILLSDEATSALDPDTTNSILQLLKKLNSEMGLTVVIISHQISVIESICNKVAVVCNHQIQISGDTQEVLYSNNPFVKKIVGKNFDTSQFKGKILIKTTFLEDEDNPILTKIIKNCNLNLRIAFAESKLINGKTFSIVTFSLCSTFEAERFIDYLKLEKIDFEEVE